jgi:phosphopentomutase
MGPRRERRTVERRAVVVVLDGVGAGNAPDASEFGDEGANTLANTARAVGGLDVPNLEKLGLGNVEEMEGVPPESSPRASHGLMVELSAAKATLVGHWEMMGIVSEDPLPTYPDGFPDEIILRFEDETGRKVIGNRPASGTEIIAELGPEQQETGAWIVYTSADSVFQVAAHTGVIPLEELYKACKKAHKMLIGEGKILVVGADGLSPVFHLFVGRAEKLIEGGLGIVELRDGFAESFDGLFVVALLFEDDA